MKDVRFFTEDLDLWRKREEERKEKKKEKKKEMEGCFSPGEKRLRNGIKKIIESAKSEMGVKKYKILPSRRLQKPKAS